MIYLWVYNPGKRRHELWQRDPAAPPGEGRVVAAQGVQGDDHSDLPSDIQFTPYSEDMLAALQGQASRTLIDAATNALNSRHRELGYTVAGDQSPPATPEMGALRDTPEQVNANNRMFSGVLDTEQARRQLQQQEYELRQKMAGLGYGPQQQADFFAQAAGGGGGEAPVAPEQSGASFAGRMPVAYQDAYGDTNRLAQRAALMQEAQRLQQAANAFARHDEGAQRLQKFGDIRRSRDQLAQQTELDEQRLRADPNQDKNLRPLVGGQWGYNQTAGAHQQLTDYDQAMTSYMQQYDPAGYQYEQQRRRDYEQGGWLPENVRRQIPRFADGGEFYFHDQNSAGPYNQPSPSGPYTPPQQDATNNNWGNPQVNAQQSQYQQQAFANDYEQRDVQHQLQQIEQEKAQRAQQMQMAHQQRMAQLNQQYTLLQTEIARQQSGVQQQTAMARAQYPLMVLPMQGQTWAG